MKMEGFTEKTPQKRLNQGLLHFGTIDTVREHGKKVKETFHEILPLRFDYVQIRQSDYELAGATWQMIDLKVKTYYTDRVSESHKVKIGDTLYDIYRLDPDNQHKYLYWYLTREGRA